MSQKLFLLTSGAGHYITAWKKLQDDAVEVIISILEPNLPGCVISAPTSKSTYPDIKIINSEGNFAIDIKANELFGFYLC